MIMSQGLAAAILSFALAAHVQYACAAGGAVNGLPEPGFETEGGAKLSAWRPYGRGFSIDRATVHTGRQAIRCECANEREGTGAAFVIRYDVPDKRPIIVGGWSKAEDVGAGGDYCVFLDVIYADGTPLWGQTATFRRGTHDWEYAARQCWPAKPVREIRAYVFLRRTTGKAWFDDVFVYRGGLHATQVRVTPDFPRTLYGRRIRADLTQNADWRCALLDSAGRELEATNGRGKSIAWNYGGRQEARPVRFHLTARAPQHEPLDLHIPVASPPSPQNPIRDGYVVWWESAMRKVYPSEFPAQDRPSEVALSLARNEHEGFQLAITPATAVRLSKVRVSFGRFVNERGDVFPADSMEKHVVGYIYVDTPSGHPQAPAAGNWCPEALLPDQPFDVPGGRTQTVWIDFHASEAAKPGTYRGKILVEPDGMAPAELAVKVRVRRFALPRTPRMKTAFAIMDGYTRAAYGEITPKLRRSCLDLMLSHRLNPDDISRTEPPAIADLLYARDHGMNAFNILNLVPKPKGNPLWVCLAPLHAYKPDFTAELASRLDGPMRQLREQGLSKMAYFYGFDERGSEYDELIRSVCKFLKQRYPEVSTFTTAGYMYERRRRAPPGDQDYMDWYCPLTPKYDPQLSARLRAEGKQVWWYVCCGPGYPYANFASMDYPSIEGRLLSWMTFGSQADGLLYWHVNLWHPNRIIDTADPYLDWKPTFIAHTTGDGCLTYPAPDGPVSSIRLENIRDGIEDYDYLALLADAKGREAAMKLVSRLVTSNSDFRRDPAALYAVREEIANQIEAR